MLALGMWWVNLTQFMPVLGLITRDIHRSKVYFAAAESQGSKLTF